MADAEHWMKIDKMLRQIRKDDPTKFQELEDTMDFLNQTPIKKFRNLLDSGILPTMPVGSLPMELESRGEKMTVTGDDVATWMTVSRAGKLAFGVIKHLLIHAGISR